MVRLQNVQTSKYEVNYVSHYSVNDQYEYYEKLPKNGMTLSEVISIPLINEKKITEHYDHHFEDTPRVRTYVSNERHKKVSANSLSELFGIGPQRAA